MRTNLSSPRPDDRDLRPYGRAGRAFCGSQDSSLASKVYERAGNQTDFLQLPGFPTQILDLVQGRCPRRIASKTPLAGFQKLLRPRIINRNSPDKRRTGTVVPVSGWIGGRTLGVDGFWQPLAASAESDGARRRFFSLFERNPPMGSARNA
jgi:hypothetical protein